MSHVEEEQISAYIDGQLDADECRAIESHLRVCESCSAVLDELRELTSLFHDSERLEPSPFLWNRISYSIKERSSAGSWGAAVIQGLRRWVYKPSLAAVVLSILVFVGVAVYKQKAINTEDQAALAEIDRIYTILAAQDPDAYNPFSSSSLSDLDPNPFRSVRLSGRSNSAH